MYPAPCIKIYLLSQSEVHAAGRRMSDSGTATSPAGEQPPQAASTNTSAGTEISGSSEPASGRTDAKGTSGAGILDFGAEGISSALETRILKGLEYSNAEQGLHNLSEIPHSTVWGQGTNKNYLIEYGTQTRVTGWVIGRLDCKAIMNNGNLLSISIKPLRTADADASKKLARSLSHPQLRAEKAAYVNIRGSSYKSQYGAMHYQDAAGPLESFKLGDIVMADFMLENYFCKTHSQKNGDFGLSYDFQVLALLKRCYMKEHEDFAAAKERLRTVAAAQTAGAVP
ncbi:hypothetical protein FRC00_014242 [Tulasnella sp. 408]|nr:hypothetical protein FRC00_014242 [Tulasnella sp. 408]